MMVHTRVLKRRENMIRTITFIGTGKSYATDEKTFTFFEEQKSRPYTESFEVLLPFWKKYQDGIASADNFYINTYAVFKDLKRRPNRAPDFISYTRDGKKSSEYWYTKDGVIRGSTHWGRDIASCDWLLESGKSGKHMYKTYGEAKWADFVQKTEIVTKDGKATLSTFKNTIGGRKLRWGIRCAEINWEEEL